MGNAVRGDPSGSLTEADPVPEVVTVDVTDVALLSQAGARWSQALPTWMDTCLPFRAPPVLPRSPGTRTIPLPVPSHGGTHC